ncbi:MAG: cobaltochelatase subunit CobN [Alphaproteobacteria bacterium]|nr:cobaltochelatase subunit CobN [Alphaproteobacteria bacterium]
MHLLAAQSAQIQQEGEAIDLGQSPAEICILSAADSELTAMAAAVDRAGAQNIRLASTQRLSHNLSLDTWIEKTAAHARLIVVRLLGGRAYWPYGSDRLVALAAQKSISLVLLPGDANPDPALAALSTIAPGHYARLHGLFNAGGPANFDAIIAAVGALAGTDDWPDKPPAPFPRFSCWLPDQGFVGVNALKPDAQKNRANVPILFYRAALDGGGAGVIGALVKAVERAGHRPLPMMISTLKEAACVRFVQETFGHFPPEIILNLTGFALGLDGLDDKHNPFAGTDAPVIQLVQSGRPHSVWAGSKQGLSAKDLAMHVVLPELDGRIGALIVGHKQNAVWHAPTQCPLSAYMADEAGVDAAVALANNWIRLRRAAPRDRRMVMVLANYPLRDGRLANGVGYDAPQSSVEILKILQKEAYDLGQSDLPANGNALIKALQSGPTNANPKRGTGGAVLSVADYGCLFGNLPETIRNAVNDQWGAPENDPFCRPDGFHLPVIIFGNIAILLQPGRGYDLDAEAAYHSPDLVPPHAYLAAYLWIGQVFDAHALVHNGKHGSHEWLPGRATALGNEDYPHLLWGGLPHLYPFIVNDPGEGTQAKRRTGAVIIDHLVPPLTRAETYGPLKDLEALLDEYFAASGLDPRRLADLRTRIFNLCGDTGLGADAGLEPDEKDTDTGLARLDTFLCELKEAQIRNGLHIFGKSPDGELQRDLLVALARVPRGGNQPQNASLVRALSDDLALGFDPLTAPMGEKWTGPRPSELLHAAPDIWRTNGDTVERLEMLASALVEGARKPIPGWRLTRAVLEQIDTVLRPALKACGPNERVGLLTGLAGRFVAPGPSGAPTRGRLDVLPTGRNFYSLDNRAVPTPTAWELGAKSAENLVIRHFQDHGIYLQSVALSVWGTANMRTGGDDIAQALALIGARPVWDPGSLRVSGYEIIPLAKLARPRVDVTLRISGLFRDAFPAQIDLFDRAIRAVGALDEPADFNPIAARMRAEALELIAKGVSKSEAGSQAGYRIFGSKPGAYGAGLQALIDGGDWREKSDLAEAFLNWGQFAYGAKISGLPARDHFARRLGKIDAVIHNQDNREHDLLDSDDYYQFEGGLSVAAEQVSGLKPHNYHNDHSRPERPVIRTLEEEVSRVMRSRVVNPKWLAGVMRHGYKGAFEIIATLDYMFAFAATTGAVKSRHFDLAFAAFVGDEAVSAFLRDNNPHGLDEMVARFDEAIERGFWTPKSNSVYARLDKRAAVK